MLERMFTDQQRYVAVRVEEGKGKERKKDPGLEKVGRLLGEVNLKKVKREKKIDPCWHKHTSKTSIALYSTLPNFNHC